MRARVAILISGRGSNMAALIYAAKHPACPFEIVLVASNDPGAAGLKLAKAEGVRTVARSHKATARPDFDGWLSAEIREAGAQYVALAGYMRLLSPEFVREWAGRLVNIHPSLLPKYPGLDTHAQALAAGDKVSGCTVHEVTETLDEGPILGATEVAILPGDTAESLADRVLIAEHMLYAKVLAEFVSREPSPEWLLAQLRERAMALPEAEEGVSHGMPVFGIVKGKKFAYFTSDHHGDGKHAMLVKISGLDEQNTLIDMDPDRYYRPAYFGDGWVGIRLDLGNTDWDGVSEWLRKSWVAVAPPKLRSGFALAEEF